jgi:predicted DCC family thiol-disulfide oxidoreductase YuxK
VTGSHVDETLPAARLTVLYDADCGFCRWSVARLLALDRRGRLSPQPIQSDQGARTLAGLKPDRHLAGAHVATADGRIASGGDAIALIAAAGTRDTIAGPLARAIAPVSRSVYRLIAGNRGTLGRLVTPWMLLAADARIAARRAGPPVDAARRTGPSTVPRP